MGVCRCGMRATLTPQGSLAAELSPNGTLGAKLSPCGRSSDIPWYDGETSVTPTRATQVLHTSGHRMAHDVTVAPIPWNYGLITFDGSVITVS